MDTNLIEQKSDYAKIKKISLLLLILLILSIIAIIVLIIVLLTSDKSKTNEQNEQNFKGFNYWVEKYNMMDHIEGGKFQYGLYASNFKVNLTGFEDLERLGTSTCYYMLNSKEPGKFHKLKGDECWLFHDGTPLTMYLMNETSGDIQTKLLGLCDGCDPLICVKGGTIFGEIGGEQYTFVSLETVPGYDDRDFTLYEKEELLNKYPQNKEIIEKIYPS